MLLSIDDMDRSIFLPYLDVLPFAEGDDLGQ